MSAKHHLLTALALAAAAASASAETSPYYIGGQIGYTHLSNALGLADDQPVPEGYASKSDNVTSLALVAGLNQPIGRQRVFGDLTVSNNRYAHNDALNNTSYALTAGTDWETVGNLSGNVTLKSNRDLFNYSSVNQITSTKNLVTTRQADAVARLGGVTVLTFEGGLGYRSTDYSDLSYESKDHRQSYWMAGVRYRPQPGTGLGLSYRDTSGRNPHYRLVDNSFQADHMDRKDLDLSGSLELSGLTSLYARLSRSKIDYDFQPDFSGFTWLVKGTWVPTGKLKLSTDIARDRGQDLRYLGLTVIDNQLLLTETETADVVTTWRLAADYQLTAKVIVNANFATTRQNVTQTNPSAEGSLNSRRFGLGATWMPTRTSTVGCTASHQRRTSGVLTQLDQSASSFGCFAQLTLQP